MALIVGTDTYIDLADSTAYLADFGDEGAVVTETDLKKATLAIDRLYGGRFKGVKTDDLQALQFPRDTSTTIPQAVEHATVELAVLMANGLNPYVQPDPVVTEETVELDVLKQSRKFASNGYSSNFLHKINVILAPVLYAAGGYAFADVVRS